MSSKIGIFMQRREYAGRIFNNLALDYVRSIEKSGALVVMIPVFTQYLDDYIALCDGFVFPGGPDIDPSLYGQSSTGARGIIPIYDRWLLEAIAKIQSTHKPILGICKGMQLINVAHGGTLKQDIEEIEYHFQPERGYEHIDTVKIVAGESFLDQIYKSGKLKVNSIHHQAVDILGEGMRVVAVSTYDDEIEAIEHISLPYFGVQWHPEYLGSELLFSFFIKQCQQ